MRGEPNLINDKTDQNVYLGIKKIYNFKQFNLKEFFY